MVYLVTFSNSLNRFFSEGALNLGFPCKGEHGQIGDAYLCCAIAILYFGLTPLLRNCLDIPGSVYNGQAIYLRLLVLLLNSESSKLCSLPGKMPSSC